MPANSRELLIRPNPSRKVQYVLAICVAILLFFTVRISWSQTSTFYEKLNPTGNPIGGGVGYSELVSESDADFVVYDKASLLSAFTAATSGTIIFVDNDAEIDLTDEQDVVIPSGVTLASGRGQGNSRGGLIYSNALYEDQTYISMFETGGPGVRITGLRMRGPYGEVGDHHYDIIGVSNGIRGAHGFLEVDNCELWNWNKWAIDLEVAIGDHIHHNYIHHNTRSGYGYGVWVRGTGTGVPPGADEIPLIEANLFDYSRHHIGSGRQEDSSWEARYNITLQHNVQQRFDRHGNSDGAGYDTWIHHNWFQGITDVDMHFRGPAVGQGLFYNNWSSESFEYTSVVVSDIAAGEPSNIEIYDNEYGGVAEEELPTAVVTADIIEGTAPMVVQFDGMGSFDSNGSSVSTYRWHFGDGDASNNEYTYGENVSYTFTEAGTYFVELMVFNEYGIPSPPVFVPIEVYPSDFDQYMISAWIKDSYEGDKSNYYTKQLLVNNTVVWEDDVAGSEGWFHVREDVSQLVSGLESVDVTFRLVSESDITDPENEIIEIFAFIDNISLLGASIVEGGFETWGVGWSHEVQGENWFTTYSLWEALTGARSYLLGKGYNSTAVAGESASVTQTIPIEIDPSGIELGDVNASGEVSAYDAVKVIQHIVGIADINASLMHIADVSGNGTVTVYDASMILKFVTGSVSCFPADPGCSQE